MKEILKNKQVVYLFLCNFAIVFIGFGLFPVLPLYATEFGASSSFIGVFLAITYIAISLGSIFAGQLSERMSRKTLFSAAGWLGTISLVLLSQANTLWQVVVLTSLVWFAGGVGISIVNVLMSLHTTSTIRGKAFGFLALTSPLGALIGSLIVGRLVAWSGYPLMLLVLAVEWSMFPILALTVVKYEPTCDQTPNRNVRANSHAIPAGTPYLLLLMTVLLASMTVSVGRMGLSMSMKDHLFSASDVSTANAFGGLLTIPVTLVMSVYSDKFGRKRFLLVGYILAMGSTMLLIIANQLWQFWAVSWLVLAARSVIASMAPAYASDILSRRLLSKALPWVGTMNWASGVVGFAGSGYVIDTFGAGLLYGGTTIAAVIAGIVVSFLPISWKKPVPPTPPVEFSEALPKISRFC